MTPRLVVLPQAREDLRVYGAYQRQQNPALYLRFLSSAGRACKLLMSHPFVGRPRAFTRPGCEGMRSITIPDFPSHLVFYQVQADRVVVVRVLHGAMDLNALFGPSLRRRKR